MKRFYVDQLSSGIYGVFDRNKDALVPNTTSSRLYMSKDIADKMNEEQEEAGRVEWYDGPKQAPKVPPMFAM